MSVQEIADFVAGIDPEARHYFVGKPGSTFTAWAEYKMLMLDSDNTAEEGWAVALMRCTTEEFDPMAESIKNAILDDPRTTLTDYSVGCDPETGYIMHAFKFEAA